jgi:TRAP-type transport system small permease protein
MFTKVAKYMTKVISYPSELLFAASMVAMVFVMLAVTADVFMRYVFNSPIVGVWDLCTIGFAIIVWGPMALAAFKGSHIAIEFLKDKLPRLPRLGLELIITLVTSGTLGIVSWRLFVHAINMGATKEITPSLRLPLAPLGYFVAVACGIMALAFLARFPEIIAKIRKEQ